MDKETGQPPPSTGASPDPFENWANDDLLISEEGRRIAAAAYPHAFPVLDWPEFREEFQRHDRSANDAKKRINRSGVTGASLSAVGASFLAVSPLIPLKPAQDAVVVVGCLLVLAGFVLGLWHLFGHSGKARWLLSRLWTERLRQFYFQYLINNFDDALAAMRDEVALANYRSLRAGALASFIDELNKNISARSFASAIDWLADDHDDTRAWGQSLWGTSRVSATTMTKDHVELFQGLSQKRIGIQDIYAQLNLKPGVRSQANMACRMATYGNLATLAFVASLTLAGVLILFGDQQNRFTPDVLIAVSGVAAVLGLYLRLVDQGMGYSLDAERYQLYAEQVALVRQRFDAAEDNVQGKIGALRQLEMYSYRELRQFLRTHFRSRFLG